MIFLTFRFYGELNDFLPVAYRHRRFRYSRRAVSSVKDAIEALGVPHPEADVIVINGRDQDFSYRLQDGDHVAVYPPFRSIDVSSLRRVGGDPPAPVRFVADVHLARLAAFLRLCGFDTLVDGDDAEVAGVGARDARVVLTRDVGLLKRAIVRYGHWVRDTNPERQLAEVLARFGLADQLQPFTRCLRCNTTLVRIDADVVADRLPARTRARFQQFHQCPECGRVYWPGSHYVRLRDLIDRVRQSPPRLESSDAGGRL